jgi:hypothetical protein
MQTTVVNIKKEELKKRGIADLEEWKTRNNTLYIGRNMVYVKGATESKWKNPFSAQKYGRDKCLELYEKHIKSKLELYDSLEELEGKELGCWCKPESCHGDILVRLLEEKRNKAINKN